MLAIQLLDLTRPGSDHVELDRDADLKRTLL